MASKVQIANLALVPLGAARCSSLDSPSTQIEQDCALLFAEVAKRVMTEGPFPSTICRAELSQYASDPDFEYSYQYQLPTNPKCLKVLNLYINGYSTEAGEFTIERDKLLTDNSTAYLVYVGYIEDTELWDESLKSCVIARLAADLAYSQTGSAALAQALEEKYQRTLTEHLSIQYQQIPTRLLGRSMLDEARE